MDAIKAWWSYAPIHINKQIDFVFYFLQWLSQIVVMNLMVQIIVPYITETFSRLFKYFYMSFELCKVYILVINQENWAFTDVQYIAHKCFCFIHTAVKPGSQRPLHRLYAHLYPLHSLWAFIESFKCSL